MPFEMSAARRKNQENLKRVESGGRINYLHAGKYVLIGDGHNPAHVQMMAQAYRGTIEVKREKIVGKGKLYCKGSPSERAQFQDEIARISKKEVVWV
jgi:folylpolyglutamate synthase/dihydropteroate synthase